MKLKPCPFCGSKAILDTVSIRGYEPCVEYIIKCSNGCCTKYFTGNNTVYHSDEDAMNNAIHGWNRRSE